jgi:CheY-like chemotaxis protein
MPKSGPIIIVEDDLQDQQLFRDAFREIHCYNQLVFFTDGFAAREYLATTIDVPFLIFCDVNLPRQDGISFKKEIDADPVIRAKSIPFIFYTHFISQYAVNEAYKHTTVQGFFQRDNMLTEFKDLLQTIINYWKVCKQPSPINETGSH